MSDHTMRGQFHHLWTKAVGAPGYDKREWQDFEKALGLFVLPASEDAVEDILLAQRLIRAAGRMLSRLELDSEQRARLEESLHTCEHLIASADAGVTAVLLKLRRSE